MDRDVPNAIFRRGVSSRDIRLLIHKLSLWPWEYGPTASVIFSEFMRNLLPISKYSHHEVFLRRAIVHASCM